MTYLDEIKLRKEAQKVRDLCDKYLKDMTDANMETYDVAAREFLQKHGKDWNNFVKNRQRG